MLNKRKFPRLDEQWELTYRVLDRSQLTKDPIRQYSVNISGGGICFTADEVVPEDTMLALEMNSNDLPANMLALARVARCKRIRDGYEIGCEFWWVGWQNNDAQQEMANYILSATKDSTSTS
ncbi:MAG: PilZ domain-containing protein [Candidatus Poribacteria bacterium]|nr:PilZ domain-containing protein [Candidatus Poribacteria bacterium]